MSHTPTRQGGSWNVTVDVMPDVMLIGGDTLLIRGATAREMFAVLALGMKAAHRDNGTSPSPRVLKAAAGLKVVADKARESLDASSREHGNLPRDPLRGSLLAGDRMGVSEVAQMLGYTVQHVRRLGPTLGGYKPPRGTWIFSKAAVEAYLIERNQQEST